MSAGQDEVTATLLFTPDNPCNTTITSSADGGTLYRVETNIVKRSKATIVYDTQDAVVATLQWRDTLSDKVAIRDGKPMSLSSWLKKKAFAECVLRITTVLLIPAMALAVK